MNATWNGDEADSGFLRRPFPEWGNRVSAAFTTRSSPDIPRSRNQEDRVTKQTAPGKSLGAYADLNLGFRCGDDPGNVSRNWAEVLAASGLQGKALVIPRMVHGDGIADADGIEDRADGSGVGEKGCPQWPRLLETGDADAVFSRDPKRVLAVTMADCLTALIFDPDSATVAAVHAGWRGTRSRILEKTLRMLAETGRIRAGKTLVAFGPCLRPESLEVGAEVAGSLESAFVIGKEGRFYFDMPGCNRSQAISAGIAPDHIRDLGGCTLQEPERYYSYRRDGQASGRLAAFISLL